MFLPPDKSIAHRALMLACLSEGETFISALPENEDIAATIRCLRALGAEIEDTGLLRSQLPRNDNSTSVIASVAKQSRDGTFFNVRVRGPMTWPTVPVTLDCGESGTTFRLLLGFLAGLPVTATLIARGSLVHRPMDRVIDPLRKMGADIDDTDKSKITIYGKKLHGITHRNIPASAQVKSALLLASLHASGETIVEEPLPTRDHTEKLLQWIRTEKRNEIKIPGDFSSAAFLIAEGLLFPDVPIHLQEVGINSTRTGFLEALSMMGAELQITNRQQWGLEPVADIIVKPASLRGITIGNPLIPRLIDELPLIAVLGAMAKGTTHVQEAQELRFKESDRIGSLVQEFSKLGIHIQETADGFIVEGGEPLKGATVSSHGDHRLAMSLALLGLLAEGKTTIHGACAVAKSYPDYFHALRARHPRRISSLTY